MRIVFIGDIMGRTGREALEQHLPSIQERLSPDVIIVNGENACHGRGINEKIAKHFFSLGVDCITTGNHIWDQREVIPYIQAEKRLIRPINFPAGTPGNGAADIRLADGRVIKVINAMGRVFMDDMDDPFTGVMKEVQQVRMGQQVSAIFVDFHAETTSEKMAFSHYLDGKVSAVIGTHTHVPTADAHVMKGGTAFQCDAGMTGDYDSVIGVEKHVPIQRFVKKMPGERMSPAKGDAMLCGAMVVTNDNTGLAQSIEPLRIGQGLSVTWPNA